MLLQTPHRALWLPEVYSHLGCDGRMLMWRDAVGDFCLWGREMGWRVECELFRGGKAEVGGGGGWRVVNKEEEGWRWFRFGWSWMGDYRRHNVQGSTAMTWGQRVRRLKSKMVKTRKRVNVYVLSFGGSLMDDYRSETRRQLHNMQVSTATTKNPRNGTASRDPQAYLPTKAWTSPSLICLMPNSSLSSFWKCPP